MSAAGRPGDAPRRGFPPEEFHARRDRAQALMAAADLDALLLTTEPDIRWFTGFLTRFWESPTRPWFLIVPASGDPVAVIPAIGEALMRATWLTDIRTWPSPAPEDDGIGLLAATLAEVTPPGARIGTPSGPEPTCASPSPTGRGSARRLAHAASSQTPAFSAVCVSSSPTVKSRRSASPAPSPAAPSRASGRRRGRAIRSNASSAGSRRFA
jgi:Xaa-Pro aminopeptidase